eukprot:6863387-Prymnesium_polylepis.1
MPPWATPAARAEPALRGAWCGRCAPTGGLGISLCAHLLPDMAQLLPDVAQAASASTCALPTRSLSTIPTGTRRWIYRRAALPNMARTLPNMAQIVRVGRMPREGGCMRH